MNAIPTEAELDEQREIALKFGQKISEAADQASRDAGEKGVSAAALLIPLAALSVQIMRTCSSSTAVEHVEAFMTLIVEQYEAQDKGFETHGNA